MSKKAVLLVNLGSPDSISVPDVRKYLDEFLSDERVIDIPKPLQQFILKCFILPFRPKKSAHAYSRIWKPEGSPLMITSRNLKTLVQGQTEIPVHLAMRYGSPSIASVLDEINQSGVEDLFLIPLYPHYAMSSYETVVVKVQEEARRIAPKLAVTTLQPFYDDPEYIDALVASAQPYLDSGYDHLLFSFHGVPERHLRKADSSKSHCTIVRDCCTTCSPVQATCYKAQCLRTTALFVERAGIPKDKYSVSFQSRLAGEQWLTPYTDYELKRFGQEGINRILVMTPAFVSDCLETLEEISMAGKETFIEAGGKEFQQIPCLNEHPAWVSFLIRNIHDWDTQTQTAGTR